MARDAELDSWASLLQTVVGFEPGEAAEVLTAMARDLEGSLPGLARHKWHRRSAELALRDARAWIAGRPVSEVSATEGRSDRELARALREVALKLRRLGRG